MLTIASFETSSALRPRRFPDQPESQLTTYSRAEAGASRLDASFPSKPVAADWQSQTQEIDRLAKHPWLKQGRGEATAEGPNCKNFSESLLRRLTDHELAHHLSQQHGDPALLEVSCRIFRLLDAVESANQCVTQCHECGARISHPL